jgi:hypothetical protein
VEMLNIKNMSKLTKDNVVKNGKTKMWIKKAILDQGWGNV